MQQVRLFALTDFTSRAFACGEQLAVELPRLVHRADIPVPGLTETPPHLRNSVSERPGYDQHVAAAERRAAEHMQAVAGHTAEPAPEFVA